MSNYKNGKWATQIIDSQKDDGSWGYFHSLSLPKSKIPITTEQAITRLGRLGYTKDDDVIKKALFYMHECLAGRNEIPDRQERGADWGIFSKLMLAARIRNFTDDDTLANEFAAKWLAIVEQAFSNGKFDVDVYIKTLYEIFNPKYGTVKRARVLFRLEGYYPISLLTGEIKENIEKPYFNYIMNSDTAYYYGHEGALFQMPENFQSKKASNYLAAIELYCEYPNKYCKEKLRFVLEWLTKNKNANGRWDMGVSVKDGKYFPLSDSWKTSELRENDCTYRIEKIISAIQGA